MSFFSDLTSDASIANEKDSVGGGGVLASGLYPATITLAYGIESAGGARGLVLHAKTSQGRDIRQTLWTTSGKAKGGKNYYEKDGQKNYLPGYLTANSVAMLTVGTELPALNFEEKVVKVYNYEAKAEVPTKVKVPVDLIGKELIIGLIKQTVDKKSKTEAGDYVATGETREENEIDKIFRASDKMTVAEILGKEPEAKFYATWEAKFGGTVRDKTSKDAGTAGAPKAAFGGNTAMKKPATSLFA